MPMHPARLQSETFALKLTGGELSNGTRVVHYLDVTFSYLGDRVHDIIFVGRGKVGHGIDLMFQDLGIQLSRALQGRDPLQGELPL
jgi:hypothetical protein